MLPRSFTARARKGELRMRKFLLLFAGALMLLSGCSTSEIGERAIIQAAAVDYDGEYIVSALLFSSGSMLYATGLQSETQTVGYYVVAAKVVLVVVALVIAAFEPKGVEMLNDCAEETAAEISDDEAGKMGL